MEDCNSQSSHEGSTCKFSVENWKILNDLREEKKKLKIFEASTLLSSQESLDSINENDVNDKPCYEKVAGHHNLNSFSTSCSEVSKDGISEEDLMSDIQKDYPVFEKLFGGSNSDSPKKRRRSQAFPTLKSSNNNMTRDSRRISPTDTEYSTKIKSDRSNSFRLASPTDLISSLRLKNKTAANTHSAKLVSPTAYISSEELNSPVHIDQEGPALKVEKYCRRSVLEGPNRRWHIGGEQAHEQIQEDERSNLALKPLQRIADLELEKAKAAEEKEVSSVMYSVTLCLFGIPKMQLFIAHLWNIIQSNEVLKKYPTLSFFIDRYREFNSGKITRIADNDTTFIEEPLGLLFSSTLEIFHEELLQAKRDGVLNETCLLGCRYGQKKTHTIISHLFRCQHLKKIFCACGYWHQEEKASVDVNVHLSEFKLKTIIMKVVRFGAQKKATTSRLLININQYTSVRDITEIIYDTVHHQVTERESLPQSNAFLLFTTSIDSGEQSLPEQGANLFELLRQGDIELCVCDTTMGDRQSSELLSQSINTISTLQEEGGEQRKLLASSPACLLNASTATSIGRETTLSIPEIKGPNKQCQISALVFVKIQQLKECGSCTNILLRLPKVCHGLYLIERFQRIFSIDATSSQTHFNITIRNKAGLCAFCLNHVCHGCVVQMSDRIVLSHLYQINILITDKNYVVLKTVDDCSMTTNTPLNKLTLAECMIHHAQWHQGVCPSCIDSSSWKASQTFMKKYADVLIIQFQRAESGTPSIVYPETDFTPSFGKRNRKYFYNLTCITTYEQSQCVYMKENDQWFLCCSGSKSEVVHPPTKDIEMLIYVRNKERTVACHLSQNKIKKRMYGKHNIAGRPLNNSRYSLSQKNNGQASHNNTSEFDSFMTSGSYTMISMMSSTYVTSEMMKPYPPKHINRPNMDCSDFKEPCSRTNDRSVQIEELSEDQKLHRAIRDQNLKEALKSITEGADVNAVLNGSTALHLIAAMDDPFGEVFAKLLVKHGADTNARSSTGQTPIHVAVTYNRTKTLGILLKHGGQTTSKDNDGKSCFDYLLNHTGKNRENLLRILRMEKIGKGKNKEEEEMNSNHDEMNSCVNEEENEAEKEEEFVNVSGNSLQDKQTIGERTFDNLFHYHTNQVDDSITMETPLNNNNASNESANQDVEKTAMLNESIVSQHFSGDESNLTFEGSVRHSWFSFFLCTGKCTKLRRRRGEERWVSRAARERFSDLVTELRWRFS
ncbi:uncharacterized protein [Clytia hemisphaerica]|uniref:uncharacterized protein isoform X2 n=1 Tax=Clytia hemisphaerica TaxID=252671 RepID=UPI0034D52FDF